MFICVRTTLIIQDELLERARQSFGHSRKDGARSCGSQCVDRARIGETPCRPGWYRAGGSVRSKAWNKTLSMILVDTSVWIDHFRAGNKTLGKMLHDGLVMTHPFVIGELACGNLRNRAEILANLSALPQVTSARHEDVLHFIDEHRLGGSGAGWIDAHLLVCARLSNCRLWSLDKALTRAQSFMLNARG